MGKMGIRTKMYMVLAGCSAALLLTAGAALLLVHGAADTPDEPKTVDSAPMVVESGYDKDQNTIDTTQYSTTILELTADAGQAYVDETLFLGDSNTARMYRLFDYCTADNAIGSVGMTARSLSTFACAGFQGYSGYQTMAQAVALMQPKRVVLTFGTNDLGSSASTEKFIADYQAGIESIVQAYPSVDIIVNAIPPLGQSHSNQALTQAQVDEFNKALVEMCQQKDWKFLNSAEALKDEATGYAKAGYVESSDGIHLTRAAMDALFGYVRTHSYITEDDRPPLTSVPARGEDKDAVVYTAPVVGSINGVITYNTPSLYQGKVFENIRLVFKDGYIVEATCNDTERLNQILDTDPGARAVGEFAIGVNPYITSAIKDTLFDEKIAGSFHFTPGRCYDECSNGNKSAIHWDLVCIQTPEYGGGEMYFDGELIRRDGLFVPEDLQALNPENLK